tara:strand:- start:170 stop:376 length:207 start_codon:yes stop_codon:yes gene_type:complete
MVFLQYAQLAIVFILVDWLSEALILLCFCNDRTLSRTVIRTPTLHARSRIIIVVLQSVRANAGNRPGQ